MGEVAGAGRDTRVLQPEAAMYTEVKLAVRSSSYLCTPLHLHLLPC